MKGGDDVGDKSNKRLRQARADQQAHEERIKFETWKAREESPEYHFERLRAVIAEEAARRAEVIAEEAARKADRLTGAYAAELERLRPVVRILKGQVREGVSYHVEVLG
jgi:cell division septum initiation protein DivIVA